MTTTHTYKLMGYAAIAAFLFWSCKKDITIKLNNAQPILTIEGGVTNEPKPDTIRLSLSGDFGAANTLNPVSAARLTIADGALVDTLTEVKPGVYITSKTVGVPGHTYHLHVSSGSYSYDASSTMPAVVPIDSAWVDNFAFGSNNTRFGVCRFRDPAATANYYLGVLLHHGRRSTRVNVGNDRLTNGKILSLVVRASDTIAAVDTVQIELQSVDEKVWEYFYTLNSSTNSAITAAPGNPNSQFSTDAPNGVLGYFSAYTYSRSKDVYSK
jgi:Domain of unknown function (DUF4249)